MRTVRQLLEGKAPGVFTIDAGEPVRTAIQLMADHFIGALPVLEAGRLAGIISERDYARKVVLMGRKSTETTVGTIMSAPVIQVGPEHTVNECMQLMTDKRIRHLPVVADGKLIGVISIGDCVKAVIDEQKHEIEDLRRISRADDGGASAGAAAGVVRSEEQENSLARHPRRDSGRWGAGGRPRFTSCRCSASMPRAQRAEGRRLSGAARSRRRPASARTPCGRRAAAG